MTERRESYKPPAWQSKQSLLHSRRSVSRDSVWVGGCCWQGSRLLWGSATNAFVLGTIARPRVRIPRKA